MFTKRDARTRFGYKKKSSKRSKHSSPSELTNRSGLASGQLPYSLRPPGGEALVVLRLLPVFVRSVFVQAVFVWEDSTRLLKVVNRRGASCQPLGSSET